MLQVLMKCLTHLPIPSLVVHNTHANTDIEGSSEANVGGPSLESAHLTNHRKKEVWLRKVSILRNLPPSLTHTGDKMLPAEKEPSKVISIVWLRADSHSEPQL
jgi:hypothetical protein